MFIRKHSGTHGAMRGVDIALAHVVSAKHINGGYQITDTRGDTHEVTDLDWKIALESIPVSTWPAAPGTHLVERCEDDGGTTSITRQTVVGWGIYADGETRPIVTDPTTMVHISDKWAVEMPSGRVEGNSLEQWASAEDWFAETPA